MTKTDLWNSWKGHGVTREEGASLFQEYEKTKDVDVWLSCLCGSRFSVPKRIKIMYSLREFDKCQRKKSQSTL